MKFMIFFLTALISLNVMASDFYSSCQDQTGLFTYYPEAQELVYNSNEVYGAAGYSVHFAELISSNKGSCVANNGKSYDYSNTKYKLRVTYFNGNSGAEDLFCEEGYDALPAGLSCVE